MTSDHQNIDFENSIGPWIGKTTKIIDYYLQEVIQSHQLDLTKEQMIILKKLHAQDGLNQNELAYLTYRDKSSLARLLSKMERKNYIIRQQDATDKRIKHIFLTDGGRSIFAKSRPAIEEVIRVMEQHITPEEKKQIIHILKKVQENFNTQTSPQSPKL